MIDALRKAKDVSPQLSSDGLEAVFEMEGGTFILYNDGNGRWKFHLRNPAAEAMLFLSFP